MAAREMGTYINRCCERSHATAASLQIRPRCARLLAKPQYFSPPDEVCCWPGRRGGSPGKRRRLGGVVAGREPPAQRTACWGAVADRLVRGTAVAERHREDVACCGTADAEPAGKGTAGTEDCWPGRCGGAVAGREPSAQRTACWDADEAAARQGRWHRARAPLRGSGAGRKQELARGVRS